MRRASVPGRLFWAAAGSGACGTIAAAVVAWQGKGFSLEHAHPAHDCPPLMDPSPRSTQMTGNPFASFAGYGSPYFGSGSFTGPVSASPYTAGVPGSQSTPPPTAPFPTAPQGRNAVYYSDAETPGMFPAASVSEARPRSSSHYSDGGGHTIPAPFSGDASSSSYPAVQSPTGRPRSSSHYSEGGQPIPGLGAPSTPTGAAAGVARGYGGSVLGAGGYLRNGYPQGEGGAPGVRTCRNRFRRYGSRCFPTSS